MNFNSVLISLLVIVQAVLPVAAQITQTVKGRVTDKDLGTGLPGVIVRYTSSTQTLACATDANGDYKLEKVPVGRQSFLFTYTGYKPVPVTDVIITSGKEALLNVDMEESAFEMDEVVVSAGNDTDVVSMLQGANMKSFSLEETERYAGSRNDPARMAQNFAGVQGTNDSRNDIVVRGNSPSGLLWRLEEIDIPNPNHFAIAGTAGGPQSIINNKYLANSEFYTGAFPANYGNALGGVFDLKMRNGNNEKHERTLQFGILGTELALEGPLNKNSGATYMTTYRYSTLAYLGGLGINFGTSAVPYYQDGSLRLNFPTRKAGVFSFSGIAGLSNISIVLPDTVNPDNIDLYGNQIRDQYFYTNMGVGILSHVISLGSRTVMKTSLAYTTQDIHSQHDHVFRDSDGVAKPLRPEVLRYNFFENRSTLAWYLKHKFNARNSLKAGFFVNKTDVNFFDKFKLVSNSDTSFQKIHEKSYKVRIQTKESYYLLQPYLNYAHKFNSKLSALAGIHIQYLTFNGSGSIEPRLSLNYQYRANQALNFACGLHSQMQPTYIYFMAPDSILSAGQIVANKESELVNRDLGFSRAQHVVLGHDYIAGRYFRIRTEIYYQWLRNVPVYSVPAGISLLNRGAKFTRFMPYYPLENTGTGYNYGLELTVEKRFHRHYFFMFSGSLFESKYKASNGMTFDTDFNGNYMMNLLGGLEYNLGKGNKDILSFGLKFTYGGGKLYSPVDIAASNAVMDIEPVHDQMNTMRFPDYHRLDFRVSYKLNIKKTGLEFAIDLINIMNTRNALALTYAPNIKDPEATPVKQLNQLGFLPIFYIKADF